VKVGSRVDNMLAIQPEIVTTRYHPLPRLQSRIANKTGLFVRKSLILKDDLRKKGLEPLRPFGHQLLRLARLPIPPLG
jgi:hypothetical protein